MKKKYILLFTLFVSFSLLAQSVFINEIHYDNIAGDTGEAIEVAGPAGTDLTDWTIVLYNGASGLSYNTIDISVSGTFSDEGAGFGVIAFNLPSNGIQNGPDALALVNNLGNVTQFLSYEGVFAAIDGPANGLISTDIGVSEPVTTPIGNSIQLTGTGTTYADFSWTVTPTTSSFGSLNAGQMITLSKTEVETVLFSVYPNPVTNGTVNIVAKNNQVLQVSVFDVLGKQVVVQTVTNKTLNVSSLNVGVYILRIAQNGNITTKKLVIK